MHTYTSFLDSDVFSKQYKRNWARLIRKIYETDPLCCPSCSGKMKVISIIERPDVVKKILQHLGLWDGKEAQASTQNRCHGNRCRRLRFSAVLPRGLLLP